MRRAASWLLGLITAATQAGLFCSSCTTGALLVDEGGAARGGAAGDLASLGSGGRLTLVTGAAGCPTTDCNQTTCEAVTPGDPLITDWKDVTPGGVFVDSDHASLDLSQWWTGFYGGGYVYPTDDPCSGKKPAYPLNYTVDGAFRVTGTVGDWSGFGLWFGACFVDLSAYRGLTFTLYGDPGPTGRVRLWVMTSADQPPPTCPAGLGSCAAGAACWQPSAFIPVPATPADAITLQWADFKGGIPLGSPDPSHIIGLHWTFEFGGGPPYPVDLTLGTVELLP
jgi:hypothetical protein